MAVNTLASRHRIDPKIRHFGKLNKLNENQLYFVHTFLCDPDPKIRNNQARSWMKAYPKSSYFSAVNKASLAMRKNPKIIKTVEAALADEGITPSSTIRTHKELIEGAGKAGKFSAAISGNRDFMEATGVLKKETTVNHNVQIDLKNLDKLSLKELNERMESLLNSDVIEGEIVPETELLD